jgi:hypothetical protein
MKRAVKEQDGMYRITSISYTALFILYIEKI